MAIDAGYDSFLLLGKETNGVIFFWIVLPNPLLEEPANGKDMH